MIMVVIIVVVIIVVVVIVVIITIVIVVIIVAVVFASCPNAPAPGSPPAQDGWRRVGLSNPDLGAGLRELHTDTVVGLDHEYDGGGLQRLYKGRVGAILPVPCPRRFAQHHAGQCTYNAPSEDAVYCSGVA